MTLMGVLLLCFQRLINKATGGQSSLVLDDGWWRSGVRTQRFKFSASAASIVDNYRRGMHEYDEVMELLVQSDPELIPVHYWCELDYFQKNIDMLQPRGHSPKMPPTQEHEDGGGEGGGAGGSECSGGGGGASGAGVGYEDKLEPERRTYHGLSDSTHSTPPPPPTPNKMMAAYVTTPPSTFLGVNLRSACVISVPSIRRQATSAALC